MSDEPDSLVLVYRSRMDAKLNLVIDAQNEHSQRLTHIEYQIAGIRRDQGSDAEGVAHVQARMDKFSERLARIERRLNLVDAG